MSSLSGHRSGGAQHNSISYEAEARQTVSYYLTTVIAQRNAPPQSIPIEKAFVSVNPPSLNIVQYFERLMKEFLCNPICFIASIYYLDAARREGIFLINKDSIHRLFLASTLLAIKYLDDKYYPNTYYAVGGGVQVQELNRLELLFFIKMNYKFFVDPEKFHQFRKMYYQLSVSTLTVSPNLPFPYRPTPTGSVMAPGYPSVDGSTGAAVPAGVNGSAPLMHAPVVPLGVQPVLVLPGQFDQSRLYVVQDGIHQPQSQTPPPGLHSSVAGAQPYAGKQGYSSSLSPTQNPADERHGSYTHPTPQYSDSRHPQSLSPSDSNQGVHAAAPHHTHTPTNAGTPSPSLSTTPTSSTHSAYYIPHTPTGAYPVVYLAAQPATHTPPPYTRSATTLHNSINHTFGDSSTSPPISSSLSLTGYSTYGRGPIQKSGRLSDIGILHTRSALATSGRYHSLSAHGNPPYQGYSSSDHFNSHSSASRAPPQRESRSLPAQIISFLTCGLCCRQRTPSPPPRRYRHIPSVPLPESTTDTAPPYTYNRINHSPSSYSSASIASSLFSKASSESPSDDTSSTSSSTSHSILSLTHDSTPSPPPHSSPHSSSASSSLYRPRAQPAYQTANLSSHRYPAQQPNNYSQRIHATTTTSTSSSSASVHDTHLGNTSTEADALLHRNSGTYGSLEKR